MNEKYLSVMNETVWRHDEEHASSAIIIITSALAIYSFLSLSLIFLSLPENHISA